ncbi:MaoC family dehydratase [Erwinia mallotivora]|uniref:Dehydratase n=1 Tax=Erwinia mallotivora TaxID=69222 RepID=A0A014NQY6_9GAMM|nr:MaoC family dehydratase [Erwinia mallotivora]EXU76225.1 dehydratase [Erwinia mallotivora]
MNKDKVLSRLIYKGNNRYEESHGLWYEDFIPGEIYMHKPGRTVTEADNIWQSLINLNNHPLHIDNEYAKDTEFGKPLVSSLVTFGIVGGLSLAGTSARGIANLGWDKVRFVHPVYVGDTLYAETEVISRRESASRPGQGIVTVETRGLVNKDTVFMTAIRSFLIPMQNAK